MGNRPSCQNPKAKLSRGFGIRGFSWWKLLPVCGLCWPCNVMLMCGGGKPAQGEAGEGWEREPHTTAPRCPPPDWKSHGDNEEKWQKERRSLFLPRHCRDLQAHVHFQVRPHDNPPLPKPQLYQCRQSSNQTGPTGGNTIKRMNSHMETAKRREGKDLPWVNSGTPWKRTTGSGFWSVCGPWRPAWLSPLMPWVFFFCCCFLTWICVFVFRSGCLENTESAQTFVHL